MYIVLIVKTHGYVSFTFSVYLLDMRCFKNFKVRITFFLKKDLYFHKLNHFFFSFTPLYCY